ncbi:MAG: universal stress protein [Vicinamibacterales bacterium]
MDRTPVICGVDFSTRSAPVVRVAATLASRLDAPLTVAAAVDALLARAADLRLSPGTLVAATRRDLDALVTAALEPLAARPTVSTRVEIGAPADVLEQVASSSRARLIVVGTRGHGPARRLWLGSTTARLLATTTHAVIAVPDAWSADGEARVPDPQRIVCGVDFQAPSIAAARAAARLGATLGIPVTLVHAVPRPDADEAWREVIDEAVAAQQHDAAARLEALARDLPGPPASEVLPGRAADVLLGAAAAVGRTLLAVGLGGGLTHRPGSTAMELLTRTDTLVMAGPREA